jgi:hypothetical protein
MTWADCSSQSFQFRPYQTSDVPLKVGMEAYSQTNQYLAYLDYMGSPTNIFTVPAGGTTQVSLPVYVEQSYSPNARVLWVAGNVTAYDPGTGQAISMTYNLNVTG